MLEQVPSVRQVKVFQTRPAAELMTSTSCGTVASAESIVCAAEAAHAVTRAKVSQCNSCMSWVWSIDIQAQRAAEVSHKTMRVEASTLVSRVPLAGNDAHTA
eukprot:3372259-Amphidinium_carterae.1